MTRPQMLTTIYKLPVESVPPTYEECAAWLEHKAKEKNEVTPQMIDELHRAGYNKDHELPVTKTDWKELMIAMAMKARRMS